MSSTVDSIATPLVRGVIGALSSLGIALAVVVVPALAAQVAGTASSATALDAILIGLSILVLGHGGGVMLSTGVIDGPVTLTPFGLLILLLLLSALSMRRAGRALRPVREDGLLRSGALRDVGSALGSYALVYAIGLAVLAGIGRSVDAAPMITSAVVSGLMVAVLGGLGGLLWSVRREPTDSVPGVRVLDLLPAPYGDVARSLLLALTGLIGLGTALVVVMMLISVPAQSALFDQLAPGLVGGLVLTLIQLALLPLVAVWALTVLLGGTVGVGTTTGISLDGAETGVLPALPMLGALPGPGDFPAAVWLLMLLPAIPVALGAVQLVRDVAPLEKRERITAWVAYPVAVSVATLVLAGLSTGGIGDGRLVHLGPQMSTLVMPLLGVVVLSTGIVLAVMATGLVAWGRGLIGSLRSKVEAAEQSESTQDSEAGTPGERPDHETTYRRSALMERFARRNAPAIPARTVGSAASAGTVSAGSAEADAPTETSATGEADGPRPSAGPARSEGSAPSESPVQKADPVQDEGPLGEEDREVDAWSLPASPATPEKETSEQSASTPSPADEGGDAVPSAASTGSPVDEGDHAEPSAASAASPAEEAEEDSAEDEDAAPESARRKTWLSRRTDR